MEFWGVEVKAGKTLKVKPESDKIIHISQAALGESKKEKGNTTVPLRLKINDKSFVMGLLATEDRPQMMVDLVFEKEFELSHDWKSGSVYFAGYTADDGIFTLAEDIDDDEISSDEDGEEMAHDLPVKGEPLTKDASADSDESGDSDADEDSTDISSSDDEPLPGDDALENSSSDDESAKKQQSKKRPVAVLPSVNKKAKQPAPQKAGANNFQAGKGPSPKDKSKAKNGKAPFQKKRKA